MEPAGLPLNRPFCLMASPPIQTAPITGFPSASAFDYICVCLGSVIFTPIRDELIFPSSVRLSAAFFHILVSFSNFFDPSRPSVTFAFAQFLSFHSFLGLPSLLPTVLDHEEQIGPISGHMIPSKKLYTTSIFKAAYRRRADKG
jgi:hypothetical protein